MKGNKDDVRISLANDKVLIKALKNMPQKEAKKAARKGSRAGQKIVKPQVQADTPVRTGKLKSQIKVKSVRRSRKYVGTRTMIGQGTEAFYGGFVEYGTKKIEARWFARQAAAKKSNEALREASLIMKHEVEKYWRAI